MDVNVSGVLNGVQRIGRAMVERGKPGFIVNTGSKQGITSPPGNTAYNVSKAAVKAVTEGLAHTLRNLPGCHISAHLLIPGFTYTGDAAKRIPVKPAAAWSAEQVAERLVQGLERNEFYILCQDNETTRDRPGRAPYPLGGRGPGRKSRGVVPLAPRLQRRFRRFHENAAARRKMTNRRKVKRSKSSSTHREVIPMIFLDCPDGIGADALFLVLGLECHGAAILKV